MCSWKPLIWLFFNIDEFFFLYRWFFHEKKFHIKSVFFYFFFLIVLQSILLLLSTYNIRVANKKTEVYNMVSHSLCIFQFWNLWNPFLLAVISIQLFDIALPSTLEKVTDEGRLPILRLKHVTHVYVYI